MATNYAEQLQDEIDHVPQEYLPALLNIVHSFRESVSLKSAVETQEKIDVLRKDLAEGMASLAAGEGRPFNVDNIIARGKTRLAEKLPSNG